jgi:ATP-binding cassette subfamily G (WHITE) protein 2 (SNQ2)
VNLGIVVVFMVLFIAALLVSTEPNTTCMVETPVVLFKRNSKMKAFASGKRDKGKHATTNKKIAVDAYVPPPTSALAPTMHNIFLWQKIRYTAPIPGEDRLLLSNVSVCVSPSKLTAHMGESGTGKTTLLNALAECIDTGVVTGYCFVNGQALPVEFQVQSYV